MITVDECRVIDLPHLSFEEGSITPVEGPGREVPFEIRRVFYVYDVVGGAVRGGHAHKELEQFIVAVMGGFTVTLWDGEREREVALNRAYCGLHVPPPVWTDLVNFSSGAVAVVLASDHYDEADYIRDRSDFVAYRHGLAHSA
jgi:dTDP-4-dehydrorhamnose 3,5-epimerase-like enzyme